MLKVFEDFFCFRSDIICVLVSKVFQDISCWKLRSVADINFFGSRLARPKAHCPALPYLPRACQGKVDWDAIYKTIPALLQPQRSPWPKRTPWPVDHFDCFHDHDEQEDHVAGRLVQGERDVINISQEEPYTSAPAMTKMTTSLITNLIRQHYIFLQKDQYCCKDQHWSIDYL